jgi:single-strand DNA-binding protein
MSDGLNRVMLIGNLGAAPELRFTQGGTAVLNFRLATSESYLDKEGVRRERTDWHTCVLFGKRAEGLAKHLDKGSRIFVEGSLRTSSFEDKKTNEKKWKTEIHVTEVLFAGGGGRSDSDGNAEDGGGHGYGYGSAPTGGTGGGQRSRGGGAGGKDAGDFEVRFGRDKGKRISQVDDLSWLRDTLEKDLGDSSKAQYHDKCRAQIASIDAELARRAGGGRSAPAVGAQPKAGSATPGGWGAGRRGRDGSTPGG